MFHRRPHFSPSVAIGSTPSGLPHTVPDVYLYYPCDTATTIGTTCKDMSGNGLDATIAGFVTTGVTGQIAQAYTMPGGSQASNALTLPNIAGIGGNTARTFCFWLRSTTTVEQLIFFVGNGSVTSNSWSCYINIDGSGTLNSGSIGSFMGGYWVGSIGSGLISNDNVTWYHIAITYDGTVSSTTAFKLYVNGTSEPMTNSGVTGSALATSPTTGGGIGWSNPMLNGSLDDIRMYTRALSGTEVSSIYTAGTTGGT